MARYLATQTREVVIEAPSAAVARTIADAAFAGKVASARLVPGVTCSPIQDVSINVEKVK